MHGQTFSGKEQQERYFSIRGTFSVISALHPLGPEVMSHLAIL